MIQQEYKNSVQNVEEGITSTKFVIEANASIYALLTQNPYNDRILAVIREWSTNACDACLAAGKPVKYDVHLPTVEEPQFYVRDYGTGLSADDIVGLFSCLGASTKRESNLYNGSMGIGRLAGFAVADAFTVESYYKGVLYSYAISMQEGIPVTFHLGDSPTQEPDGLKLSVAVEYSDIKYYKEKAEELYPYFDYKPTVNYDSICLELEGIDYISDNWFIKPADSSNPYRYDNYLVMSQILYKIPRDSAVNNHNFRGLVLRAEPGSVTFNPGRESLSLDKKTIAYLNEAFTKVKDEYATIVTTSLAACENDSQLVSCYYNLTDKVPPTIKSQIDPIKFMSPLLKSLVTENYGKHYTIRQNSIFDQITGNLLSLSYKPTYRKTTRALDADRNSVPLNTFFNAEHVIADLKTGYKGVINTRYRDSNVIVWQRSPKKDINLAVEEAKNQLTAMGISYKMASKFLGSRSVSETSSSLPREGLYINEIDKGSKKVLSSYMLAETEAKQNSYLYIKLKNTTPDLQNTDITFDEYLDLYIALNKIKVMPELVGVAKKYQHYIEDLENWTDIETYMKEEIKNYTFKTPKSDLSEVRTSIQISTDTVSMYPLRLQHLFKEVTRYKDFCKTTNLVTSERTLGMLKKLGASIEVFDIDPNLNLPLLQKIFKISYEYLFGDCYFYGCSGGTEVLLRNLPHLAKAEEFYALHSSE